MPGNTKGHFAKYVSIRQTLEREIISGSFPDGSLLPPEHKLAAMFGVGRGTLRLALKELRQQGFVESRRGAKSRMRDISRNCRKLRIVWLGNAEWSEYEPLLRLIYQTLLQLPEMRPHQLIFFSPHDDSSLEWLLNERTEIDGVVVPTLNNIPFAENLAKDAPRRTHFVSLNPTDRSFFSSIVISDNQQGGYLAAEYLRQRNYRNFLVAGISAGYRSELFYKRIGGFCQRVFEEPALVNVRVITSVDAADQADPEHFLRTGNVNLADFDAVFGVTDDVAAKLIQCAQKHGLRVPEDLAVIGFDGLRPAPGSSPQLTTIGCDAAGVAQQIFQAILNPADSEKPALYQITPLLLKRGSVGRR